MLTIQFLCPLPNGLHARPAWELKEQCSQWQSEVTFINHRQNTKADAKSSLALIGTGTLFNDSCSLNISGSDEEQARRVLEEYIQARFIDSDSIQPTQAELATHPLPRSLSRLNPDLLYGNILASGVGVGTLTLLQSDSLDSYRAIPASAQDITRLEHSQATLAEQLNQQLRERDGESKTILSAHLSLIQDDEFAGNIRRLMAEQHQGLGAAIINNMEQICAKLSASASDYLRERVSDIRDISEQLLHITWPELKPRNNLVLEKTTITGDRRFNPKPVPEPRTEESCGHDSGENRAYLAYPDSGPRLGDPGFEWPAAGCDCPICRATGGTRRPVRRTGD